MCTRTNKKQKQTNKKPWKENKCVRAGSVEGRGVAKQESPVSQWMLKGFHMDAGDTQQSLAGKELSKTLVGNRVKGLMLMLEFPAV